VKDFRKHFLCFLSLSNLLFTLIFSLTIANLSAKERTILKIEAGEGIFLSEAQDFENSFEMILMKSFDFKFPQIIKSSEAYTGNNYPITGKIRKIKSMTFLYLYRWNEQGILLNSIIIDISDPRFLENLQLDKCKGIDKSFEQFLRENYFENN
jgi:hypothetical protein